MSANAPFPKKRPRDDSSNGARRPRQMINLVSPSKNPKRSRLAHSSPGVNAPNGDPNSSARATSSSSSHSTKSSSNSFRPSVPSFHGSSSSSSHSHLRMSSSAMSSTSSSVLMSSSSMSSSSASAMPYSRAGSSRSVSSRAGGNKRSYASSSSGPTSEFSRLFAKATTSSSYQDLIAGSTSSSKPFDKSKSTSNPLEVSQQQQEALIRQRQNSPDTLLVSMRQKGNPLLKSVRNVRWTYADILPDYVMGDQACALYLSLRYHKLHPKYLHGRIQSLKRSFRVRVLLIHVDVEDNVKVLEELTNVAFHNDWTLMCCWSSQEAARYLETFQSYENKPADVIKEKIEARQEAKFSDVLNVIRSVNKTDVITLGTTFGTMAKIMQASKDDLEACPGLGPVKVQRIYDTFRKPFLSSAAVDPPPKKNISPQMSASSTSAAASKSSSSADSTSSSSTTSSRSVSSFRAAVRSQEASVITDAATGKIISLKKS